MNTDRNIRSRAIKAMKAVTAGALLCAGLACADDGPDSNQTEWNIGENDVASQGDTGGSNSIQNAGSSDAGDDGGSIIVADVEGDVVDEVCNDQESTGFCPEQCSIDDDVDCCEANESDMEWCNWNADGFCSCVIEGPFVPPTMPAHLIA